MDASFFSQKTTRIPVQGEKEMQVTGRFVRFTEATGLFEFRFGHLAEWLPSSLGREFRLEPGELFTTLYFRLPDGAVDPVVIEFEFGVGTVLDNRLNIVRERPNQLFLQVAPTKAIATPLTGDQIPATDGEELFQTRYPVGNSAGVSYRKALIVSNLDPSSALELRDEDGETLAIIPGAQTMEFETSADVEVYNPTGAPISCRIGEIFYLAT